MPTCNMTPAVAATLCDIGLCIRQAVEVRPLGLSRLLPALESWEGVAQGGKPNSDLLSAAWQVRCKALSTATPLPEQWFKLPQGGQIAVSATASKS